MMTFPGVWLFVYLLLLVEACTLFVVEESTIHTANFEVIMEDYLPTFIAFKTWYMHHESVVLENHFFRSCKGAFIALKRY